MDFTSNVFQSGASIDDIPDVQDLEDALEVEDGKLRQ